MVISLCLSVGGIGSGLVCVHKLVSFFLVGLEINWRWTTVVKRMINEDIRARELRVIGGNGEQTESNHLMMRSLARIFRT